MTKLVFLNCPFDPSDQGILSAIVFCVQDAGFVPRCALERLDSTEVRLDKICEIISLCDYAIHDISYVELDPDTGLPRFDMPFELGVFLGCKRFGGNVTWFSWGGPPGLGADSLVGSLRGRKTPARGPAAARGAAPQGG